MLTGIEGVGIVLAIPGLIDLCIKYGEFLVGKIRLFVQADDHTRVNYFALDLVRDGIADILHFLRDEWDQLEQSFKDMLEMIVPHLQSILIKAIKAFPTDTYVAKRLNMAKKVKYAVYDTKKVEEAVKDMELWSDRFIKRTDLYMRFVFDRRTKFSPGDQALDARSTNVGRQSAAVEYRTTVLEDDSTSAIVMESESTKRLLQRLAKMNASRRQSSEAVFLSNHPRLEYKPLEYSPLYFPASSATEIDHLVEYQSYNSKDSNSIADLRLKVRNIAVALREVDPQKMHILRCRGFCDHPADKTFSLHFEVPEGRCNPRSLRSLLADPVNTKGRKHSLSDRLRLAQSLATAVLYIHSCGYVHKNIRPENIIIFDPRAIGKNIAFLYAIGDAFLVGYDGVRMEDAYSELNEPRDWKERIYLPRERLRAKSDRSKFTWRHDIYSLGVILEEIAIWQDFTSDMSPTGKLLAKSDDPISGLCEVVQAQTRHVPCVFGDRYMAAATACLSMLREEENIVNDEEVMLRDADGIALGTSYIAKVLDNLEMISL